MTRLLCFFGWHRWEWMLTHPMRLCLRCGKRQEYLDWIREQDRRWSWPVRRDPT